MPHSPSRLVLFDFDGTLADSMVVALEVYNGLATGLGVPKVSADDAALRRMTPRQALKESAIPLWKVPILMNGVRTGLRDRMLEVKPFAGIDAVLAELARNHVRYGIVSSNARENIEAFLAHHGFTDLPVLGAGTSLFGKAAAIRKVLAREKVAPGDAIYVGDEVRDVAAARAVGMTSVAVSWGYADRSALVAERPDHLVDAPSDLTRALLA